MNKQISKGQKFLSDLENLSTYDMSDRYEVSSATVTKWRKEFDIKPKRSNLRPEIEEYVSNARQIKGGQRHNEPTSNGLNLDIEIKDKEYADYLRYKRKINEENNKGKGKIWSGLEDDTD